ncbi:hypothetical protein B0I37DRAFT_90355 [Chaetomium sp. MPI-CAGE-AT-0009]|nr:hypothetical protein B0I37DRAFT_90355 [Chaetomium sp. MPI-CAGE-AT-0009]
MPRPICHYEGVVLRGKTSYLTPNLEWAAAVRTEEPLASPTATVPSPSTPGYLDGGQVCYTPTALDASCAEHDDGDDDAVPYTNKCFPSPPGNPTSPRPSLCTFWARPRSTVHYKRALMRNQQVIEAWQRCANTTLNRNEIIAARCSAIQRLHNMIADPAISTSDETITAVLTLVFNDLCFGETQALRVHVEGAREMVMARGGLAALGTEHDLAKMVLV